MFLAEIVVLSAEIKINIEIFYQMNTISQVNFIYMFSTTFNVC